MKHAHCDEFGNTDWDEGFEDPEDVPRFTPFERLIDAGFSPEQARREIERRAERADVGHFDCTGLPDCDGPDNTPEITHALGGTT